jgi:hypothetical protein
MVLRLEIGLQFSPASTPEPPPDSWPGHASIGFLYDMLASHPLPIAELLDSDCFLNKRKGGVRPIAIGEAKLHYAGLMSLASRAPASYRCNLA